MVYQASIIIIIFTIFRIITTIALFFNWQKTKNKNKAILLLYFLGSACALTFLTLENILLYDVFAIHNAIIILVFIDRTFYQDRKSPFKILLILTIVLGVLTIMFFYFMVLYLFFPIDVSFFIHNIFLGFLLIIYGFFSFIASSRSLKKFSSDEVIEPWVKNRYKLVRFYSISTILVGLFTPFSPISGTINWALLLILVFNILKISGETLAWVMPKRLKKYYNRDYTPINVDEDLTEEEILEGMK